MDELNLVNLQRCWHNQGISVEITWHPIERKRIVLRMKNKAWRREWVQGSIDTLRQMGYLVDFQSTDLFR